jgi:hypothetical protein
MDFFKKPPDWVVNNSTEGARSFLENGGWYAVLGVIGLIVVWILWALASKIVRALVGGRKKKAPKLNLTENLMAIPAPPPLTGDRRLTVEGVPVRLRLVVLAPAGRAYEVNTAAAHQILDKVLPGLGQIAEDDQPLVRLWPFQLSYEGFANQFHNNTPKPEGEDEPSRWVLLAGRAHIGSNQIMLGLGLQAVKPTTVGRLHLDRHDWSNKLRIRTRE